MFLLAGILFLVENQLQGFAEVLLTELLVLHHNFWVISACFTQGWVYFVLFQRVKQTHGIFHLLLNRHVVMLLHLCVQVGSKVLLFQKKVFLQRIILYSRIKSFL